MTASGSPPAPRSRRVAVAATVLLVGGVLPWILTADSSRSTAVLGLYRVRWFVVDVALTWAALWIALGALRGFGRDAVFRLVLVHVGLGVALAAIEAVAWLGLIDFRQLFDTTSDLTHRTRPGVEVPSMPRHPELRKQTPPYLEVTGTVLPDLVTHLGVDAAPVPFAFRADRWGLRNATDRPAAKVVCLGDSILAAGLLRSEQTLTERLQSRLGVEVLNVSEAGYSPQEELLRFATTELDPAGRTILHFVFEGNDLGDSIAWRAWRAAPRTSDWPKSGLVGAFVDALRTKGHTASHPVGVFTPAEGPPVDVHFFYRPSVIASQLDELSTLTAAVTAARDDFKTRGASYGVVLVPAKRSVLGDRVAWTVPPRPEDHDHASPFLERLAAACVDAGIPHLDLTPTLRDTSAAGRLPYFGADTHLNEIGHAVVADRVAAWLNDEPRLSWR